ncbi:MAG: alkaline phosphatase family protein [Methanophagales archaeon]|nr:alkaline phosphatase family protein [Methanophagales archaeon]
MSKGIFFVLGIDAATWSIVTPNLHKLRNFKRLIEVGKSKELILKEKPISASVWCGMFSGKLPEEHKHGSYVVNGEIVKREDIKVDFIWDVLEREGKKVKALNVPFVVPPYSFGVNFKPIGFGLPTNEKEWEEELERVTEKTKLLIEEKPDLLIAVYTLLDRIQHFHWGEDYVVEWYRKMDEKIGELIFDTGFLDVEEDNELIVISDHGFCSFGEAKVQTLPEHTKEGKLNLKGDHHENALLITVNVNYEMKRPQDVFYAINFFASKNLY